MNLVTKKKFYLMLLVVVLILLIGVSTKFVKPPKTPNQKTEERSINDTGAIIIDFDGDGVAETLKVEEKDKRVNMVVFDINGKELADLVEDITLYPTTLYKVIKLRGNSQKQYLQWNMAVGPHQVETVFLTIYKDKVFPVYSYDIENKYMYSPFYNSRGELLVEDVNNDGLKEVMENIDEYPVNAPKIDDPNLEKTIRDGLRKNGLSETDIQTGTMILIRENYGKGRGRKVIMDIHSFVDGDLPYFRKLPSDEYENIADPLVKTLNEVSQKTGDTAGFMKYTDLFLESKGFNLVVREFWTHGRAYKIALEGNEK